MGQAENRVFQPVPVTCDIHIYTHEKRESETVGWGGGVSGEGAGTIVGLPSMSDTALRRLYSK